MHASDSDLHPVRCDLYTTKPTKLCDSATQTDFYCELSSKGSGHMTDGEFWMHQSTRLLGSHIMSYSKHQAPFTDRS